MNSAVTLRSQMVSVLNCNRNYLFLAIFTVFVAIPNLFTTLAPYDDEGYVMMTVKSFSAKHPLYEETHTQYGPAYYLITEPIHSWLKVPLTQQAVRLKTACYWVIATLISMAIVYRLSGNRIVALITGMFAAFHLDKLALEPGHPQELALVLSLLSIWCVCHSSPLKKKHWVLAALAAGVCSMIKLNCGFVVVIPLLLVGTSLLPADGKLLWLNRLTMIGLLSMPIFAIALTMLKNSLLCEGALLAFPVPAVLIICWSTLLWKLSEFPTKKQSHGRSIVPLVCLVLTGAIVSFSIVLWTYWCGTSWSNLYRGMVGQHLNGFTQSFFHPTFVRIESIATLIAVWKYRTVSLHRCYLIIACTLVCATMTFATASNQLQHGLMPRGAGLWLMMVGPAVATLLLEFRTRMKPGRILLAGVTILSPWIAFPTPGTQVMIGTIPGILCLGVLLGDAIQYLRSFDLNSALSYRMSRFGFGVCCVFGVSICIGNGITWWRNPSLQLPGSEWVHVAPEIAARERSIVKGIEDTGASYLVFDGHTHNRFYFWTKCEPLTNANPTFWPRMLSHDEQLTLRTAIERSSSLCVVVPTESEKLAGSNAPELRRVMLSNTDLNDIPPSGWKVGSRRTAAEQTSAGNVEE